VPARSRPLLCTLGMVGAVVSAAACSSGSSTSAGPASSAPAGASSAARSSSASPSSASPSSASSSSSGSSAAGSPGAGSTGIAATSGYSVRVFAKGSGAQSNPDSIIVDGHNVYVGYQNVTAKDGTDHKTSTVVQYDLAGKQLKTFGVPGHQDGMRMDPATHLLWSMSNEDGHPQLVTIDASTAAHKTYGFAPTAHGGGYDDIVFTGGKAYLSASNPTVKNATNPAPAVVSAVLTGSTVRTTPVLMGNAKAKDANSGAEVAVAAIDPDSMFIDPAGNLTLDNQAGTALVSIHQPGPRQSVTQLTVGTQIDDTVYPAAASGRLLVSDTKANTVYAISGALDPKTPLVATPDDSGVNGLVGKLNTGTGNITPIIVGFTSPHGMAYLPT